MFHKMFMIMAIDNGHENRDKIIVGDEEEEGGRTWNNCESSKEKEVERKDTSSTNVKDGCKDTGSTNVKEDDTIEIREETISRVQRIKEEGNDLKEDDGKRRGEGSQQWFYQAILNNLIA